MKYKRKKTNVSKNISQSSKGKKLILKRQVTVSIWILVLLLSLSQLGIVKKGDIKSVFTYGSKAFKDLSFDSIYESKILKNTGDYIYSFCFGHIKENDSTKALASKSDNINPKQNQTEKSEITSDASAEYATVLSDGQKHNEQNAFLPIWPCEGDISSGFGERVHPVNGTVQTHNGVDLAVDSGTEIMSCESGMVDFAGYNDYSGNYVVVNHADGYTSLYLHLSKLMVSNGDTVNKGDVVGLAGNTGVATGPHLHFEIKKGGAYINPTDLIKY